MKKPTLWLISFVMLAVLSFTGVADVKFSAEGFENPAFTVDYLTPPDTELFAGAVASAHVHGAQCQHGLSKSTDPVNEKNNASRLYTNANADEIVNAALNAGDAIDSALAAPTKQETIYYWQKVFGSSFHVGA